MNMNAMSDNAFWVIIVSVVMGCITVMSLGRASKNVVVTVRYIDAGYTKTNLTGNCGTVWVKEAK